jgi:hypothetical protein
VFIALAETGGAATEALPDGIHVKTHRSATGGKGSRAQAIGVSRGGRTSKLHALTDGRGPSARLRPDARPGGALSDC